MNCLDNLIGINNICTPVTPSSGLYIQNLPGITLSTANAATNNETQSGVKLLQDIITFSQNKLVNQIRNQIKDRVLINSVIGNDIIGFYKSNMTPVSLEAGKLKGIKIRIDHYPSLDLYIGKIYLKLSTVQTIDVLIIDFMTGEILDTLPITTVANVPTAIIVNKSYPTNGQRTCIGIAIDSEISSTFQTSVSNTTLGGCASCNESSYSNKYLTVSGFQMDDSLQKIESNTIANEGTNGLSIEYSLNCSVENFICSMAGNLAWPLLHDVGAELMRRLKYTERLNSIVLINGKNNEDLRAEFDAEYMSTMSALLDNIKMPNDICFNCNSTVRKVTQIP